MSNDFEQWVKDLVGRHFGGRFQAFADEVGVTFSALSRSVRKGSTSVDTLLRICIATGEPPEAVFTAAGKRHVHDLIQQLYGEAAKPSLSKAARDVAALYDALDDEGAKRFVRDSLQGWKATAQLRAQTGAPEPAKRGAAGGTRARPNTRLVKR